MSFLIGMYLGLSYSFNSRLISPYWNEYFDSAKLLFWFLFIISPITFPIVLVAILIFLYGDNI